MGDFVVYRMYSGDSEDDLKKKVIENIMYTWGDEYEVSAAFEILNPSLTFKEISKEVNNIMNKFLVDTGKMSEYDLIIGDPTSDISDCFDFYGEYMETKSQFSHYEDVSFYFYGAYSIRIQNLFPYLYDLVGKYGVTINNEFFNRLDKDILQPSK